MRLKTNEKNTAPKNSLALSNQNVADLFNCSIDYILCREDEVGNVSINENLSFNENELLRIYRASSAQNKKFLLTFAKGLDSGFYE